MLRKKRSLFQFLSDLRQFDGSFRRNYEATSSIDIFLNPYILPSIPGAISLDLGCGDSPRNPFNAGKFCGVDVREELANSIYCADLSVEALPFADNEFTYCTAFDFLEHIPRQVIVHNKVRFSFVELMNEVYRVLAPGGLFFHSTPAFPCKEAFQDPTHVNFITEDTMPSYFCESNPCAKLLGYGFNGKFHLVDQRWLGKSHLVSLMRAIKS